ncbi:hypothetical protein A5746_30505 [Mycolicibacterium conceptionense]|nr:DUF6611 family protein [Mycolicibacterium conceptionense]OBJ92086.1 hypothetical protein A5639_08800 [Mycolicibacterium conceptionense]OMB83288.1 hypothetical protein A5746_30505 [Mycolicibacterium conceptionense]OMB84924.1 hypothetical protein A5741_19305 [Mycolicibacterium conceptionense]
MDGMRLLTPLLDGARVWGCVQVRPGRFGITYYRLVVYPPGLSTTERRLVRLARGWPLWGMLVWLMCQLWLGGQMSPWPAFGASTAVFVATGAITLGLSGDALHRVRTLCVTTMAGYDDQGAAAARDHLVTLAATLLQADERRDRGELTAVNHELIWWQVYNRMDADHGANTKQAS